jgi:hypothetical protein
MLHVRVVSPAALTGQIPTGSPLPRVQNVVVRAGAARRLDGDAVQFDVRDRAANPVFTALRARPGSRRARLRLAYRLQVPPTARWRWVAWWKPSLATMTGAGTFRAAP